MRKMLCLAILLPLIALAGGKADLRVQNVVNDGQYVGNTAPVYAAPRVLPKGSTVGTDVVGRIDTVGGTTYDWQINGNSDKFIEVDSLYGVHVTWMYSASTVSPYADRNMRYNFYDFTAGAWDFVDPSNFMNSGVNAFTIRSGYGMLDVDPVTGVAYICCHQAPTANICPTVARDAAPGAGIFTVCAGTPTADLYQWPSVGLTSSEQVHAAVADGATTFGIFESDVNPWCTWSTPAAFQDTAPIPGFPTYIATGSKHSTKAVISWVYEAAAGPFAAYYRMTTDDGATWGEPVPIPLPPAFTPGSDSLASFSISGLYPFLDDNDNLHIVANIGWTVAGMANQFATPTEIWHYDQPNGMWSKIARWGEDTTSYITTGYGIGYNSLFCGRPTLCQSGPNEFECVWEGFDSLNYESQSGLLRSEIFAARSVDQGATWGPFVMLTDPDSTSKRIPSIASHTCHDTCYIRYEDDLIAGYGIAPYAQGPMTNNPIIVQRFWKGELPSGIAEGKTPTPTSLVSSAYPNPFRGNTVISYSLPRAGRVSVTVYDVAGRPVKTLVNTHANPGSFTATWDGRAANGALAATGVYFYTLVNGNSKITRKLTLLQ
jgi:hypothetical protein